MEGRKTRMWIAYTLKMNRLRRPRTISAAWFLVINPHRLILIYKTSLTYAINHYIHTSFLPKLPRATFNFWPYVTFAPRT